MLPNWSLVLFSLAAVTAAETVVAAATPHLRCIMYLTGYVICFHPQSRKKGHRMLTRLLQSAPSHTFNLPA